MHRIIAALAIIIAVTLGSHGVAFAGPWQVATKITQIIIEGAPADGRIYVRFVSITNTEGCGGGFTYSRVYGNTNHGENLLSLVLAAKLADREVVPQHTGCDDWGRPILSGFNLI